MHTDSNRINLVSDAKKKQNLKVEHTIHKKRAKAFFEYRRMEAHCVQNQTFTFFLLTVKKICSYWRFLYNFTIVKGYSRSLLTPKNITSYCWTENQFQKNVNTIAFCAVYHLFLYQPCVNGFNWYLCRLRRLLVTGHNFLPPTGCLLKLKNAWRKRTLSSIRRNILTLFESSVQSNF